MHLSIKNKRRISSLFIILFIVFSWSTKLDKYSDDYISDAFMQAGVSYGTARTANALVSMLQTATINAGIGVGGSLTVGGLLDPLNDMIERFADVITVVLSSLVLQKVLLVIASNQIFSGILTILGLLLILILTKQKARRKIKNNTFIILFRIFLILIVIRFSLAIVLLLNNSVDTLFLSKQIEDGNAKFSQSKEVLNEMQGINISSDEQNAIIIIQKNIDNYKKQKNNISTKEIPLLKTKLQNENNKLNEAKTDYLNKSTNTGKLGIIGHTLGYDSLLSDSEKEAMIKVDNITLKIKQIEKTIKYNEKLIEKIDGNIKSENAKIPNNGLLEKLEKMKENLTIANIEAKVSSMVDNVISLLTLYILKTILIPLSFYYLLLILVKNIWKMELLEIMGLSHRRR